MALTFAKHCTIGLCFPERLHCSVLIIVFVYVYKSPVQRVLDNEVFFRGDADFCLCPTLPLLFLSNSLCLHIWISPPTDKKKETEDGGRCGCNGAYKEERRKELRGKGVFLGQKTPGRLPSVQEELTYNVIVIARFGRGNSRCCNHTHAGNTFHALIWTC